VTALVAEVVFALARRARGVATCRGTLRGFARVTMRPSFVTFPALFGGVTGAVLLAGVMSVRVDT
jgi:hypothetical protein